MAFWPDLPISYEWKSAVTWLGYLNSVMVSNNAEQNTDDRHDYWLILSFSFLPTLKPTTESVYLRFAEQRIQDCVQTGAALSPAHYGAQREHELRQFSGRPASRCSRRCVKS